MAITQKAILEKAHDPASLEYKYWSLWVGSVRHLQPFMETVSKTPAKQLVRHLQPFMETVSKTPAKQLVRHLRNS
jgi:NADPH-dependent 7-cyano-7-deazaguanine reductase QueF